MQHNAHKAHKGLDSIELMMSIKIQNTQLLDKIVNFNRFNDNFRYLINCENIYNQHLTHLTSIAIAVSSVACLQFKVDRYIAKANNIGQYLPYVFL